MSSFPTNARTGQTHKKFGRKYAYSEITSSWTPLVPLASVAEVRKTEATAASATQFYALATDLPLSGNTAGSMAFVQETNRLYLWSGTGWYNVATISGAGSSITGANSSYTLATDGTPIVVTLSQTGLTSPTWSYQVTSGSIGRTATVTQADNVFTITPSTRARDIGSFGITFKATDGSNTLVATSQFSMSNTAPVISSGPSATYTLASDGTPTVITLAATDADGHDITWSYEVVSGSLGGTTVSINGSEFTITPSVDTNDAGTFQLRFVASDGASFDAEVAEFALDFGPDWTAATLLYTLDNPDSSPAGDRFGVTSYVSGDRLIVGAWNGGESGGKAYIYDLTNGQLIQTLSHPPSSQIGGFGEAVVMDGNYAVVGAQNDSTNGSNAGGVYIFNVTTGQLLHTILGTVGSGSFGGRTKVSISGEYALLGDNFIYDGANPRSGVAYIYNVVTGQLVKTLVNPNPYDTTAYDQFGFATAIYGNYAAVSAAFEDTAGDASTGYVYVYKTEIGDWSDATLIHTIINPLDAQTDGLTGGDAFGSRIGMNENYIVVGVPREDSGAATNTGIAHVYDVTTGNLVWTIQSPQMQSNTSFGTWVSVAPNNYAYIGVGANAQSYFAHVYDLTTGQLVTSINRGYPEAYSTVISNKYLITGNPSYNAGSNEGQVKVYKAG